MIELSVQNLKKSFEIGQILLDGLTFEILTGECVGIMGRNGCGKTTLFRMLTGELEPDDGTIVFAPNRKVGLISQIPVYPAGYTVENVLRSAYRELFSMKRKMEALEREMTVHADRAVLSEYDRLSTAYEVGGGYEMDTNVDKICNGLGIPAAMRDQLFSQLSGGEKTRVNLARLLLEQTDVLLLDEPTNHLDLRSVEWLEAYIKQFKGTTLTISHDRFFLDRVVDRIIEISDGHAEHYNGNYSFYLEEKQARFNLQLKQYEQEQAKIKQLSFTVERMKGWGINNRVLYRRAMAMQHRLERIRQTERPKTEKTLKARFGEKEFFGDMVFSVKDMAKRFGEKQLFSDVELLVEGGERIAILGDNGTGKTTFLRCLLGEEPVDSGRIRFGPTVKTAYLPQVMHFDHPERTLYDTMLYFSQAAKDDFMANYANNETRALELIAEAGWADTDGDGILDKDGQKFEFGMYASTDSTRQAIVQAMQEHLKGYEPPVDAIARIFGILRKMRKEDHRSPRPRSRRRSPGRSPGRTARRRKRRFAVWSGRSPVWNRRLPSSTGRWRRAPPTTRS